MITSELLKKGLFNLVLGGAIGTLAGVGHLQSAQEWEDQQRQYALEAKAYDDEVERERYRDSLQKIDPPQEVETGLTKEELATILHAINKVADKAPEYSQDIPAEVQKAAIKYGTEYGLSPAFLMAIAKKESGFDPEAKGGSCVGLMQVSLKWHRDRMERLGVTEAEMWTIDGSMHVAADYLAELHEKYQDPGAVLLFYNGDSRAESFVKGECGLSSYAKTILRTAEEIEEGRWSY